MKNLIHTATFFNVLKIATFIIAIVAYMTPATAQIASENAVKTSGSSLTSDLEKIKQEKSVIEARSKVQEAACYKKFAVGSCLQDVKTEKLTALNDAKRREIELNNQVRAQKEKAFQSKQEKRDASKTTRQAQESPETLKSGNTDDTAPTTQTTRTTKIPRTEKNGRDPKARAEKLPADDQQRLDAAKKRVAEANQKQAAAQKKAQLRAEKQSQSAAQTASYEKKLQLAEARKNELAQKQAARTKPKSAPLPIPSAAEIAK